MWSFSSAATLAPMRVDRAGFLACSAALIALTACPREPELPPAVRKTPDVVPGATIAAPDPRVPSGADASADASPNGSGAASAALPACADVEVPPCVDFGLPGPTCETGTDPGIECARLREALRPDAARAAVTCMIDRRGTCRVHATSAADDCFLGSLSSACERPGVRAACAPIVAKCGGRLEEDVCVAALSAVKDEGRARAEQCLARQCDGRCYDAIVASRSLPSKPTTKAVPGNFAAEMAKWKGGALPAEWTTCRLRTDCLVVPSPSCGNLVVNHRFAAHADEIVRRETAQRPGMSRSCRGIGRGKCVAGVCTQ